MRIVDRGSRALLLAVRVIAPFLLVGFTFTACSDSSSGDNPSTPTTQPNNPTSSRLGNIQNESTYLQTNGNGEVLEQTDPNTPDPCCFADIVLGQRRVRYQPSFFAQPAAVQSFFRAHEYGHHYLRHETDFRKGFAIEQEADAYGIRVVASLEGDAIARQSIQFVLASNSPGDATHPPSSDRAAYMTQVLDAFATDPTVVPNPPVIAVPTITGTLVITNTVFEPANVYINASLIGWLNPGQTDSLQLPPGNYRIDLQGRLSGQYYIPAFVTLQAGQVVAVP